MRVKALIGFHNRLLTTDRTLSPIQSRTAALGRAEINVFNFYQHEEYDLIYQYYDVALGRLDSPIVYSSTMDAGGQTLVRPVCMATKEIEKDFSKSLQ